MIKPRILIVDDDDAITQQLYWTLCEDYEVMTANDMQTAIRRATIYEPAVSIIDLHLPPAVQSPEVGMRILQYIKDHVRAGKVVVVSSADGDETRKACYAAGADDYLDKPFETEALLASLRRMATPRSSDFA
jgi:DNA-binding response OmpR family regulator